MKKNNEATDKRSMLIGAILNNNKEQLQAFSSNNNKSVVVLDTFLDALIWSSNGGFDDTTKTFICTDRYNQMWDNFSGAT